MLEDIDRPHANQLPQDLRTGKFLYHARNNSYFILVAEALTAIRVFLASNILYWPSITGSPQTAVQRKSRSSILDIQ